VPVTKSTDEEVKERYDRGGGGYTLDQWVLIDCCIGGRMIRTAESE